MFSDLHVVADRTKAGNMNCNVPRLRRGTFCVAFSEQFEILPYHVLVKLGTRASKDKLFVPRGRSAVVLLERFRILSYHALVKLGTRASKDKLIVPWEAPHWYLGNRLVFFRTTVARDDGTRVRELNPFVPCPGGTWYGSK